jgi:predicted enzyme related to lactoylglutathione lyase
VSVLINIDVPDLERAFAFYGQAFGLTVRRRFGTDGVELAGWPSPVFLLRKEAGSIGAGSQRRT